MIYGCNPNLSSHGIDTIMDYGQGVMEELNWRKLGKEKWWVTSKGDAGKEHQAHDKIELVVGAAALLYRTKIRRHHPCSRR
jgi:hypothetical protein